LRPLHSQCVFFCCHAPSPRDVYTPSLHDALPICHRRNPTSMTRNTAGDAENAQGWARFEEPGNPATATPRHVGSYLPPVPTYVRSEEHTSELQSRENLVCRLLLEKKTGTRSTEHC